MAGLNISRVLKNQSFGNIIYDKYYEIERGDSLFPYNSNQFFRFSNDFTTLLTLKNF